MLLQPFNKTSKLQKDDIFFDGSVSGDNLVSLCQGQAHVQAGDCRGYEGSECENTCRGGTTSPKKSALNVTRLQRRNKHFVKKTNATFHSISIHFIHTCFPCRFKSTKSLRMTHLDVLCASDAIWFHTEVCLK